MHRKAEYQDFKTAVRVLVQWHEMDRLVDRTKQICREEFTGNLDEDWCSVCVKLQNLAFDLAGLPLECEPEGYDWSDSDTWSDWDNNVHYSRMNDSFVCDDLMRCEDGPPVEERAAATLMLLTGQLPVPQGQYEKEDLCKQVFAAYRAFLDEEQQKID